MTWLVSFVTAHWLSLVLLIVALAAVGYVYKRREKFAKNRFE